MAISRVNNSWSSTCGDCGQPFKASPHPEVEGLFLMGCLNPQCEQSLQGVRDSVQQDLDDLHAEEARQQRSRLASVITRGKELLHRPGDPDLDLGEEWPGVHDAQSVHVAIGTGTHPGVPDTDPVGHSTATR